MDPQLRGHPALSDAPVPRAVATIDATKADVLIVGHTHRAFEIVVEGRGRILNPAALLRDPLPGVDVPAATGAFGVLDGPEADRTEADSVLVSR